MVVNGDSLIDVDPHALLEFHTAKHGWATITLGPAGARNDVGFVTLDPNGQVEAFAEKQPGAALPYHNAGLYVFRQAVLREIPERQPVSLEMDVLPALLPRGVFGFVCDTSLYDIGTPERLGAFVSSRHGQTWKVPNEATTGTGRKQSS